MSCEGGFGIKLRLPSLDSCVRNSLLAAFDGVDGEGVYDMKEVRGDPFGYLQHPP